MRKSQARACVTKRKSAFRATCTVLCVSELWQEAVQEAQGGEPIRQHQSGGLGLVLSKNITRQQGRQLRKSQSYKTSMQLVESQMEIQGIWKGSALGRLPDSITTSCRGRSGQAMQCCQVEMPANLHWYSV